MTDQKQTFDVYYTPCPKCGRSRSTSLTFAEALELFGYGKADCAECLLTAISRSVLVRA